MEEDKNKLEIFTPKIFDKIKEKTVMFRLPQNFASAKKFHWTSKLKDTVIKYTEKYSVSDVGATVFFPEKRPALHIIFIMTILLTVSYMGGKLMALYFSPLKQSSSSRSYVPIPKKLVSSDISSITTVDLFKAEGNANPVSVPIKITNEICHTAARRSSLPIKLVNSIVLMDSVKSLASIQIRNNQDIKGLREGDEIPSLAKINKIEQQKVILKNLSNGQCEYIQEASVGTTSSTNTKLRVLDPVQGKKVISSQNLQGIQNVGNAYKIKKSLRDEMLANISEVLTQANAVQIKNPDGSLSFRMTEIVPNSIYSKLDIQNGDVIQNINGKKFYNVGELMKLFNQIATIDQFQITLDRNGSAQTLEYNFE